MRINNTKQNYIRHQIIPNYEKKVNYLIYSQSETVIPCHIIMKKKIKKKHSRQKIDERTKKKEKKLKQRKQRKQTNNKET